MSSNFTQIEHKPGTVAGDFTMSVGGPVPGTAVPRDIVRINVERISLGKRLRKIDQPTVDNLYEDIWTHGLLQPIGVQQSKDGPGKYVVVYGAHRFLAFRKGWEKAQALMAERGERDPEGYQMAQTFQNIPAIVHHRDMTIDYALLKEISENLIRQNLTRDEQAAHQAKYTHLIKKLKKVVTADENRSETQKTEFKQRDAQAARHPPTATEKASTDLGIDPSTLRRAHNKVSDLAMAVARDKGLAPPIRITPETPADEKAEHTLRLADMAIAAKAKAAEAGEDPRKVYPVQPTRQEEITVRIDITDPEQLLGWFRNKLSDAEKPMSMKYLKGLHQGLGKLIADNGR